MPTKTLASVSTRHPNGRISRHRPGVRGCSLQVQAATRRWLGVKRDTVAELVMILVGLVIFTTCAVICGMAAFGQESGLPGGRILPAIGLLTSLGMVGFAAWRLSAVLKVVRQ